MSVIIIHSLLLCYAWAFGFPAHRLVASLTWDLLDAETRECLGFVSSDSAALNKLRFTRLACRPDRIKHRPGMEWAQPLHFFNGIDNPPYFCLSARGMQAGLAEDPVNLIAAARNYTTSLALASKPLSKLDQREILSFMVHFLADLHQPLHVNARLKGGIKRRILFEGKPRSLHALWDTSMLDKWLREGGNVKRAFKPRIRRLAYYAMNCDDCFVEWATQTNAANCKYVWRKYSGDYSDEYYGRAIPGLLDLLALAAFRTATLLSLIC